MCCLPFCFAQADVLYQDNFDNDGLDINTGIGGGAISVSSSAAKWTDDGEASYDNASHRWNRRAIMYSKHDTGFRLKFKYKTGSLGSGGHNFSFGLVSADSNPSSMTGLNPFLYDNNSYGVGANLTQGTGKQGLNFSDGFSVRSFDQSGTRAQFKTGEVAEVSIEIEEAGYWCYRIDGQYEASGVLLEGFDLTKAYHVVVYGQDDNGGGKVIESITLENAPGVGDRAIANVAGTWSGGENVEEAAAAFRTLDYLTIGFNLGASQVGTHRAPHRLLESFSEPGDSGDPFVPAWGDLSSDVPTEFDSTMDRAEKIRAAGFRVKAYTNCAALAGITSNQYIEAAIRWEYWCDNDPEAVAFVNSQPYHTGIWNNDTQEYEDASAIHPERKYMFCYAEFVLKEYSLRYGHLIDSWIFDSGGDISSRGDNARSGLIEDQRLYQAFTNAVRAGNPDISTSYNNGRSTVNHPSYPFADAVRFEDYTFGHAFGGNFNHAEKVNGNQFNLNYQHISRMMDTDGFVHDGGRFDWDNNIVGTFNSKLSTTSWFRGPIQAWEEADFLQWNLEAVQSGAGMSWTGSNVNGFLRPWSHDLLSLLDDHLAEFQSPGAPNWARAYTNLPEATTGQAYHHVLTEGVDFWDPEGDDIIHVTPVNSGAPSWLKVREVPSGSGQWVLSGFPTESDAITHEFELRATDSNNQRGFREVELKVNLGTSSIVTLRKKNAPNFALDGGVGGANGQNVYLWSFNANNVNQQFVEVDRGNGFYSYIKQNTNFALDGGAGGATGQNLYLWESNPANFNQQWEKISIEGNVFQLRKRNSIGFSIDGGASGEREQNVYLWNSNSNNQNQQWIIE